MSQNAKISSVICEWPPSLRAGSLLENFLGSLGHVFADKMGVAD